MRVAVVGKGLAKVEGFDFEVGVKFVIEGKEGEVSGTVGDKTKDRGSYTEEVRGVHSPEYVVDRKGSAELSFRITGVPSKYTIAPVLKV